MEKVGDLFATVRNRKPPDLTRKLTDLTWGVEDETLLY